MTATFVPYQTSDRWVGKRVTKQHRKPLGRSHLRPCLHGSGQIFAQTKTCSLTSCLHWTAGTGQIFEWLSVQVWDLKKAGQLFDRHGSIFIWTCVNTRTMQLIAQIARLRPGIKCCNWFKICTDPCKHHCNRICTEMGSKCQATVSLPKQSVNQVLDMRSIKLFWIASKFLIDT